jgi:murein DD-endopeptidase MepM/ murein hydrolase activator NlpD
MTTPSPRTGYILPFIHSVVDICQGYHGEYSHNKTAYAPSDDSYSLDFKLPLGTPVRAAKEGRVRLAIGSCTQHYTGLDRKQGTGYYTNQIILLHEDDSFTLYSHLEKDSLLVQRDQYVKQGQLLAKTGLSGWIGPIPHLHFSAGILPHEHLLTRHTFPIQFNDYEGPLEDEETKLETMCFSYG